MARLARFVPLLLVSSLVVMAALAVPRKGSAIPSPQAISYVDELNLIEHLPALNPPGRDEWTDDDALGIYGGCGTGVGGGPSRARTTLDHGTSDRILLHSGQEVRTETDLAAMGLDGHTTLQLMRRHTSRRNAEENYCSMFGPSWEFNYRHVVVGTDVTGGTDYDSTSAADYPPDFTFYGFGRTDVFTRESGTSWYTGGTGRFGRAHYDSASSELTVFRRGGTQMVFETEWDSNPEPITGVLTQIISPNGNTIDINYTGGGDLIDQDLTSITDSFGRTVTLSYTSGRVSSITDWDSRVWSYTYRDGASSVTDPYGALLTVAQPDVTDVGGLTEAVFSSANRKTTTYTYVGGYSDTDDLDYALESIVYPKEHGSSQSRLAWTYYTETSDPEFGFVHTHTVGNTATTPSPQAGGTYSYSYTPYGDATGNEGVNDWSIQVVVTNRRGVDTTIRLNRFGQVLSESIATDTSIGRASGTGPAGPFVTTYAYTNDGLLTTVEYPAGNGRSMSYNSNAHRAAQGNVTEVVVSEDVIGGTSPAELKTTTSYEPVYNRPYEVVTARGYEGSNSPSDYTTTFYYAWMEAQSTSNKAKWARRLGLSFHQMEGLLNGTGGGPSIIVDDLHSTDINGDGVTNQDAPLLIKSVLPDASIPNISGGSFGTPTTQSASEVFAYNANGQRVFAQDAEGNVEAWMYFDAADPEGDGGSPSAGEGGFLKDAYEDVTSPSSLSALYTNLTGGTAPSTYGAKWSYAYTSGSNGVVANLFGVPTKITDPRGVEQHRIVNELDQVVSVFDAAVTSGGMTAFNYRTNFIHDANDNVVAVEVENTDRNDGSIDDFIRHEFIYNVLDNIEEAIVDAEPSSPVMGTTYEEIVTCYIYDESENLRTIVRGEGSAAQSKTAIEYDERDIWHTRTRGKDATEESSITNEVDANGNITKIIDAHQSNGSSDDELEYTYDEFDRLESITDALGNEYARTLDDHGALTNLTINGPIPTFVVGNTKLAEFDYHYDERGRLFRRDEDSFHYTGYGVGTVDGGALGGTSVVSEAYVLDKVGLVVEHHDADGDRTEFEYDGQYRLVNLLDPMGNEVDYVYDDLGNLTQETRTEGSSAMSGSDVFVSEYSYDSLNRLTSFEEPSGNFTYSYYDSLGNLIRTKDALDNEVEYDHDRLSRLVESRQYLRAGQSSGSNSSTHTDVVTIASTWDELSRLVTRTDDEGVTTTYTYDDLDRLVELVTGSGGGAYTEEWSYNDDSEITQFVSRQGVDFNYETDALGRVTAIKVDGATYAGGDTIANFDGTSEWTAKTFTWDGLGRLWANTDENDPAASTDDVEIEQWRDSLGRTIRERQAIGTGPTYVASNEFQGRGRQVSLTFPEGREIEMQHDALDRMVQIDEASGSPTLIAEFDWVGPGRIATAAYGNGVELTKVNAAGTTTISGAGRGYDTNGRHKRHEWVYDPSGTNTTITHYDNTYNAVNRRTSETRHHLDSHVDNYTFDSMMRMTIFRRDTYGDPTTSSLLEVNSARTFDGVDAMTAFSDEGTAKNPATSGALHQYSAFAGGPRSYDGLGNLSDDESGNSYSWDPFGRLIAAEDSGASDLIDANVYDALDRRVLKDTDSGDTQYLYAGAWQVVEERDPNAWNVSVPAENVLRQFVTGHHIDDHLQMRDLTGSNDDVYYYHKNSQGFVGALTDDAGAAVEFYEYSMLGEPTVFTPDGSGDFADEGDESTIGNPYQFQGRRYEGELGWLAFRHRYFDARVGEFVSVDPLGVWSHGSGRGYDGFAGDPWNYSDPLGLYVMGPSNEGPHAGLSKERQKALDSALKRVRKGKKARPKGKKNYMDPHDVSGVRVKMGFENGAEIDETTHDVKGLLAYLKALAAGPSNRITWFQVSGHNQSGPGSYFYGKKRGIGMVDSDEFFTAVGDLPFGAGARVKLACCWGLRPLLIIWSRLKGAVIHVTGSRGLNTDVMLRFELGEHIRPPGVPWPWWTPDVDPFGTCYDIDTIVVPYSIGLRASFGAGRSVGW